MKAVPPARRGGSRTPRVPRALTIAGSDSSGGAGIQADLRTFTALGVHGSSAITAITAQGTTGVRAVRRVDPAMVRAQIEAVLDDVGADAVKTGMLFDAAIVRTVIACLDERHVAPVVDPVMVAGTGARLLSAAAERVVRDQLVPRARLLTPNLPEAEVLLGRPIGSSLEARVAAARELLARGPEAVLLKGGHGVGGTVVDVLAQGGEVVVLASPRLRTSCTHGTGCTLSAAVTALLARGLAPRAAVAEAHEWLRRAIGAAVPLGAGLSPVHHMHAFHAPGEPTPLARA